MPYKVTIDIARARIFKTEKAAWRATHYVTTNPRIEAQKDQDGFLALGDVYMDGGQTYVAKSK